MICRYCQSPRVTKNGHIPNGKQNYRCFACNRQFVENPTPVVHSPETRAQVLAALNERMSLRGAERVFHVARQTIARWLREAADAVTDEEPPPPTTATSLVLELDEVWSFVQQRRQKAWLWVALERTSRRVIAWVSGDRSAHTAQALWHKLPPVYRQHSYCYTDFWQAYAAVIPAEQHSACGKEQGQTNHSERWNNTLRQRVGRFVRQTLSFSTCERMHVAALTWFMYCYNLSRP